MTKMTQTDYVKIIVDIATSIFDETSKLVDKAKYNKAFTGKITERISQRKCKVLYRGEARTTAIYTDYEVGDIVRVCVPNNNYNDCFVMVNCGAGIN